MTLTLNSRYDDVKDIDNMRLIALRYEMESDETPSDEIRAMNPTDEPVEPMSQVSQVSLVNQVNQCS